MSNDRFVHAYIRVSDLKSKKSGISPESQVALANEYKSCLLNSHQWCNRKYPDDANDGFYMDLATSAWRGKPIEVRMNHWERFARLVIDADTKPPLA